MFDALVDEVTRRIEATEGRERSRRQTDQQCFLTQSSKEKKLHF